MPATPYANVRMILNGGAPVEGAQTVAGSTTVQLFGESTSHWENQLWEIYEYPDGFPCPVGWTNVNGIYRSDAVMPALITLSAAGTRWGKYMFRLTVNDGFLNGEYRGPDSEQPLVDISCGVKVLSPNYGLHDVAFGETNQFDSFRQWIGDFKKTLRILDLIAGGGGGGAPGGAVGAIQTNNGIGGFGGIDVGTNEQIVKSNGTSWVAGAVNLASAAAVSGILGIANGGTGVSTLPGSDNSFFYNNGGLLGGASGLLYNESSNRAQAINGIEFTNGGNILVLDGAPTASRSLTLPDATDTLVGKATTDTFTNKTFDVAGTGNILTSTAIAVGDLLKSNGTQFVRFARGTALQVLRVNAGGTDIEWGPGSGTTPGGSDNQFQYNNGGVLDGTSGFTYNEGSNRPQAVNGLEFINGANVLVLDGNPTTARTLTLPDATDTLVARATTDTLTNKTINATNNTITDTSIADDDLLKAVSGKFVRFARGAASTLLQVTAGNVLAYGIATVAMGGTGLSALPGSSGDHFYNNGGVFAAKRTGVIFDDLVPTNYRNIRSNRATDQSPIDNTKVGITNFGSVSNDTGGPYNGTVNANYATVGGGHGNSATGISSIIPGGERCEAAGQWAKSSGYRSRANDIGAHAHGYLADALGPYATAFGREVAVNQSFAFGAGYQIVINSAGGVGLGEVLSLQSANQQFIGYNLTGGTGSEYSTLIGYNGIIANNAPQTTGIGAQAYCSVPGEVAFGGAGLGLGLHYVAMNRDINATSDYLRTVAGAGLILQAFATYEVIVHLEANTTNDAKRAIETFVCRVHNQNGGVGYIDGVERRGRRSLGLEAHGWTFTFSHPGGNEVRMTFNAGSDNVRVHAIVKWSGRAGLTGDTTGSALGTAIVPYVTESSLANGYVPVYNSTTLDWVATNPAAAAIGASTDTQVLFNDAGVINGDAGLTYNKTTDALRVNGYLYTTGSTVSTVGFIRHSSAATQFIAAKNSVANDVVALAQNGDALYVGSNHDLGSSYSNVRIWSAGGGDVGLGGGGTTQFLVNSGGSGSYQNANLGVYGGSASFPSVGGGAGVFAVGNVGTAPTSSPSGGFVLWSGSGNMEIRTPTSARVTIGDYVSVFTTVASAATTGAYRLTNTAGIYYRTTMPNDALLIGSSGAAGIAIGDANTSSVAVNAGTTVTLNATTNVVSNAGSGAFQQFNINSSTMLQIENGAIRHAGNIQGMLGPVKFANTTKTVSNYSDYTLTAGESEALFLVFSGTVGSSGTKNIILPDVPNALYYVVNACNAADAVTISFKRAGGSTVDVTNSSSVNAAFIRHDGTNYVFATALI